jgi:hypothetical protein
MLLMDCVQRDAPRAWARGGGKAMNLSARQTALTSTYMRAYLAPKYRM